VEWESIAAANWHALATLTGRYAPRGPALLIDIGSTTTDMIPISDGVPVPVGRTDPTRLASGELVYCGVKRTPIAAVLPLGRVCAELFATMHDCYSLTGEVPENAEDSDTADGRPSTQPHAVARLARMLGGDADTIPMGQIHTLMNDAINTQLDALEAAARRVLARMDGPPTLILSGSGEFLAQRLVRRLGLAGNHVLSLSAELGPALAGCAPAYAVAVLAEERLQ